MHHIRSCLRHLKRLDVMWIASERMVCHSNSAKSIQKHTTTTNKDLPSLHYLIVQNDEEPLWPWAWKRPLLGIFIHVWLQLLHVTGETKKDSNYFLEFVLWYSRSSNCLSVSRGCQRMWEFSIFWDATRTLKCCSVHNRTVALSIVPALCETGCHPCSGVGSLFNCNGDSMLLH